MRVGLFDLDHAGVGAAIASTGTPYQPSTSMQIQTIDAAEGVQAVQ